MADEKTSKPKTEVLEVSMSDGRKVGFAGKRKLVKETLVDSGKIVVEGDTITLQEGAIGVRLDFRNGESRTFYPPLALIARAVGHGFEQKLGDETAGTEDVDDMVLDVDDLIGRLQKGEWTVQREGGGFAGAGIVVRAIMEVSGKSLEEVKAFLERKLADAEKRGEKLSRRDLYAAFRNPNSKTGQVIERMEKEKLAKGAKLDADQALSEI